MRRVIGEEGSPTNVIVVHKVSKLSPRFLFSSTYVRNQFRFLKLEIDTCLHCSCDTRPLTSERQSIKGGVKSG